MKKVSNFQIIAIGLMLLSMFLGAGNIIFAPIVGQQAGTNTPIAMLGFLITGVGLVILAIIALTKAGGTVEAISNRVNPKFSIFFCVTLFLALGPFFVIPRTTSVVYEIGVRQFFISFDNQALILFIFSAIFIVLTVMLSWETSKFVDRIGKIIAPIFSILLIILILKSIITPMGGINAPVEGGAYVGAGQSFFKGFTEGYFTMDVLAAFVFGAIFIKSIEQTGITDKAQQTTVFIKAGLVTIVGLTLLQVSMAWIGFSSVDNIGILANGGEIIALASESLFGIFGLVMIGTVVFLTGLTTNVACLAAVSEYFSRILPKVSYKQWLIIIALFSLVFTNFGLSTILNIATPFLLLLYPIAIGLIILVLTEEKFGKSTTVYVWTTIGIMIIAVPDAIKSAGIAPNLIDNIFGFIPLFSTGAGWIITGLIGFVVGMVLKKKKSTEAVTVP